ncbi:MULTISPECIES: hypothetical protein [unclassified Streptomyces]|uniref:hypothetical protein n=1 Tax=unclassified Streptomyces TaxID=2593676 RepID=UPI003430A13F
MEFATVDYARLPVSHPLDAYGAELPAGTEAAAARDEALSLLDGLHAARHGLPSPRTDGTQRDPTPVGSLPEHDEPR